MNTKTMNVYCDRCGKKAEVLGVDMGPDRSPK